MQQNKTVRLPPDIMDSLKRYKQATGVSITAAITFAVRGYLERLNFAPVPPRKKERKAS